VYRLRGCVFDGALLLVRIFGLHGSSPGVMAFVEWMRGGGAALLPVFFGCADLLFWTEWDSGFNHAELLETAL